jgi:DnaK suppressor protein
MGKRMRIREPALPGHYLTMEQLASFRRKLMAQREELVRNAGETGKNLREGEVLTDPSDRATQEEEHAIELRTRDRERKLLRKVEDAIRRIDDGTYGYCEETGEPIGVERLTARPTATLSLDAQERREKLERVFGR